MNSTIKNTGQVFTPKYLVNLILDEIGYQGSGILKKHCIDNSCGNGAFLSEIITRCIKAYKTMYGNVDDVVSDISVDITKDNGKTVHIGNYSTVEELDNAISDAVKNGQLTQEEADSVRK